MDTRLSSSSQFTMVTVDSHWEGLPWRRILGEVAELVHQLGLVRVPRSWDGRVFPHHMVAPDLARRNASKDR